MTDKQINKFSDLTFTQIFGHDLVATFNNNSKIKELREQLKAKEQECERLNAEVSLLKESNLKLQPIEDVRSLEKCYQQQLDQLKKQNDIMLNCLKKLQNKICSNTSQCKYFLMDVLKEVENASK